MRFRVVVGIVLLCFSHIIYAQSTETAKFLTIADVHFTPFTSCKMTKLGACDVVTQLRRAKYQDWQKILEQVPSHQQIKSRIDTSYALLKSSLQEIQAIIQTEHPRFILLLGDVLPHNFREQYIVFSRDTSTEGYRSFVKKTLLFLAAEFQQVAPNVDLYPVLGNNDSYTGDYRVVMRGDFLRDTTTIWAPLIKNTENQQRFRSLFPVGGYYAVDIPGSKNQRIVVLNTVLFSSRVNKKLAAKKAAQEQLVWLHDQLKQATSQHKKVIVAYHIPDGIDVFQTVQNIWNGIVGFWQPEYSNALQQELRTFPDTVTAILPAHIHMDSFQILTLDKTHQIPISFTPAISPIFGNNPGFKVYTYDTTTLQLKDFVTYFYLLRDQGRGWQKEYNFNQVYQTSCQDCELAKGMAALQPGNALANYFKSFYAVGSRDQPIVQDHYWLPYYWCGVHALSRAAYMQCVKQKIGAVK